MLVMLLVNKIGNLISAQWSLGYDKQNRVQTFNHLQENTLVETV